MSETEANTSPPKFNVNSTSYTITFMVVLSLICALILSVLASALKIPQEEAKELDRVKQMMIAAQIMSPYGYFQVKNSEGQYVPAKLATKGALSPSTKEEYPSGKDILDVYGVRFQPLIVNDKGDESTFKDQGIDESKYLSEFRKRGYYKQQWKLIYKIFPNPESGKVAQKSDVEGYVIPVNGMGLWDAIYGYLAIKPNGDTVIGISWYDQKETPGLGANISEPEWQRQFPGKKIFQESSSGKTDFKTANLGITVVKGKVSEILGNSPKALSAVDGMAGATLTGNGVTDGYRDVLAKYRPFLIKVHEASLKTSKEEAPKS